MSTRTKACYTQHFRSRTLLNRYPSEHLVRMLMGRFPRLNIDKTTYEGSRLLEVGCGDGRNIPLYCNLGFEACATEITEEICRLVKESLDKAAPQGATPVVVRVGSNSDIPFPDEHVDWLVSWNACYYLTPGIPITQHVAEFSRVMRRKATLLLSVPMATNYLYVAAEDTPELGANTAVVRRDPFGKLNGVLIYRFAGIEEIEKVFAPAFEFRTWGQVQADHFGIRNDHYLIVGSRL